MSSQEQIIKGKEGGKDFVDVRSPRILTMEQVIALSKMDMTKFDVERVIVNKWEVGTSIKKVEKVGNTALSSTKGVLVEPLFQVKVIFKAKDRTVELLEDFRKRFMADIKSAAPKSFKHKPVGAVASGDDFMLEFGLTDFHVGKFSSMEETGEKYSIKDAQELFEQAVLSGLADTAHLNVSKILIPVGNDMLHFDDMDGNTTRGTPQTDRIGRYFEIYRAASRMYRWAIERCAEVAPVHFITIPGNHDFKSVFHLGEELGAWYHAHEHVTFNNLATPRKYIRHGINLIGFTHGNEEQASILGAIMAREVKADWAQCSQHEWHLGHTHRMKIAGESVAGVRIRWLPSLSASDSWHTRKGFIDRRSSEAYIWGKKTGYKGHLSFNVV